MLTPDISSIIILKVRQKWSFCHKQATKFLWARRRNLVSAACIEHVFDVLVDKAD